MKEYRNAIRSKKMIKEAFAQILNEKQNINKVTIKEIVERADISKSTFYAHFDNIDDLIEDFENEIIAHTEEQLELFMAKPSINFFPYISSTINFIKENEQTYRLLISGGIPYHFVRKIKVLLNKKLSNDKKLVEESPDPIIRKAALDFVLSGFIGMIEDYFTGTLKVKLDDIAHISNQLLLQLVANNKK